LDEELERIKREFLLLQNTDFKPINIDAQIEQMEHKMEQNYIIKTSQNNDPKLQRESKLKQLREEKKRNKNKK